MLLGVLWGEAHLDVALGDHLGGGARQLLRSARRNRRRRGVRRPLHLIIVVLRWQQPVSGISRGWSPAKWGSWRCTGPRACQVPWTYTATMQQRARLQQTAPHIVILIVVLAALRGGRVRRVLLLPLGPLLALLLVLPVPAGRREGDCSHPGALDLRSRVSQPGACGYVVGTLQHEQMQGSACTHFFLLSFLTLASLSRLSPAASCIRSSSCFFSLPK